MDSMMTGDQVVQMMALGKQPTQRRERIATLMMAAMVVANKDPVSWDDLAERAILGADALIAALDKREEPRE